MARIRCPECDSRVRLPDDVQSSSVRCDECGFKIRFDDEDRWANVSIKKPAIRKKKNSGDLQSMVLNNWAQFLPVAIVVPLSMLLLLTGVFISGAGVLASILGIFVFLGSFIWSSVLVFKLGHYVSADYMESMGPIRWVLILGFLGFYVMGYVVLLYIAQVMSAISRPKLMLPWMFLQAFGMFLIVAGTIVENFGVAPARQPAFVQVNQQVAAPNAPINPPLGVNPGEIPNNPPPPLLDDGEILPPPPVPAKILVKKPELPPAARVTGDEGLDSLLAELGTNTRWRAADRLARMQPNEHRAVVARKLAESLTMVRAFERTPLLRALRTWGTAEEVPALLQLLGDNDINTRNEVMQVLGKVRDARAVASVVTCLQNLPTRFHAERALIEMGPMAEKDLLPLLSQKKPDVRSVVVRILRAIGTSESIPALEAASQDFTLQLNAKNAIRTIQARSQK